MPGSSTDRSFRPPAPTSCTMDSPSRGATSTSFAPPQTDEHAIYRRVPHGLALRVMTWRATPQVTPRIPGSCRPASLLSNAATPQRRRQRKSRRGNRVKFVLAWRGNRACSISENTEKKTMNFFFHSLRRMPKLARARQNGQHHRGERTAD